jgi:hypothetical protein
MASDYSSFVGEIPQVLKRIENLWYITGITTPTLELST